MCQPLFHAIKAWTIEQWILKGNLIQIVGMKKISTDTLTCLKFIQWVDGMTRIQAQVYFSNIFSLALAH